ncbi:hypothetical protein TURU_000123 [Turdus rufiventris]|nr:hypothetical protein TURU_000123 [Turdus rufiventris]
MLDVTGFFDDPGDGITKALAKACVKVSKYQQEFQRHRPSGATTATPQPPGVDVHTDLFVSKRSYKILRDALQTGATGPLRIKCHKFEAQCLSAYQIMNLLQCLDSSCLQRVKHGQGMLPSLRKLSLKDTWVSGNLRQILG